jgi:hypothetical protein
LCLQDTQQQQHKSIIPPHDSVAHSDAADAADSADAIVQKAKRTFEGPAEISTDIVRHAAHEGPGDLATHVQADASAAASTAEGLSIDDMLRDIADTAAKLRAQSPTSLPESLRPAIASAWGAAVALRRLAVGDAPASGGSAAGEFLPPGIRHGHPGRHGQHGEERGGEVEEGLDGHRRGPSRPDGRDEERDVEEPREEKRGRHGEQEQEQEQEHGRGSGPHHAGPHGGHRHRGGDEDLEGAEGGARHHGGESHHGGEGPEEADGAARHHGPDGEGSGDRHRGGEGPAGVDNGPRHNHGDEDFEGADNGAGRSGRLN